MLNPTRPTARFPGTSSPVISEQAGSYFRALNENMLHPRVRPGVKGNTVLASGTECGSQENKKEAQGTGNTSEDPKRGSSPVSVPLPRMGNTLHSPSPQQLSLCPYLKLPNPGRDHLGPGPHPFKFPEGLRVLSIFRDLRQPDMGCSPRIHAGRGITESFTEAGHPMG